MCLRDECNADIVEVKKYFQFELTSNEAVGGGAVGVKQMMLGVRFMPSFSFSLAKISCFLQGRQYNF